MVNTQEARPARRPQGSLSARQWQELRQAARLSRSEGVEVSRYGFTFRPALGSNNPVHGSEAAARGAAPAPAPSPATAPAPAPSMRQATPRNVRRAQEHQALMRVQGMWLPLVLRLARKNRTVIRDSVWTSWMRARMSPKLDARLRLRDLLWRAWTTKQVGSSSATRDLSLRDVFMRDTFCEACKRMSDRIASAIQAQEEILLTCPDPGRPSLPTRGVDEAGLMTPASARKGKKSRGRGGRGS